ncbi:hypothetical protein [Nakamurella leprariae]|uniref:Integral membrane protein n=1 Tax=Nakamurella leprariae TaxID=2803911 RepID=A0A939BZI4_9ACTN|nr:hypothetical protein [Nakamurella leprariae]MBM9468190.1 hypothetical protein [Nakamurella leprariae]
MTSEHSTPPADPPPLSIPAPRAVRIAAVLVVLQGVGLLGLAVGTLFAGAGDSVPTGRLLAQVGYYAVLAVAVGACGQALLRGRRWGRTPSVVIQVVVAAVGVWMITPSDRTLLGIAMITWGLLVGALLLSRPANAWIERFPLPFAAGPDR